MFLPDQFDPKQSQFSLAEQSQINSIVNDLLKLLLSNSQEVVQVRLQKYIKMYGKRITQAAWEKLFKEHENEFRAQFDQLPKEQLAQEMQRGYKIVAQLIESAGLTIEKHFRIGDTGFGISEEGVKALEDANIPYIDRLRIGTAPSMKGIGIDRHPFWHHLALERVTIDQTAVNDWGLASIVISAGMRWIETPQALRFKPRFALFEYLKHSPQTKNLDPNDFLFRCRYHDPTLLMLAAIVREALLIQCNYSDHCGDVWFSGLVKPETES